MLTPKDIENPQRKSGYNYVGYAASPAHPAKKPYQAMKRPDKNSSGNRAIGPRRGTALESAQDYCDYVNGQAVTPAPRALKTAGHSGKRERLSGDEEVQAALGVLRDAKGQREGRQGYVYCIAEPIETGMNAPYFVKVGYSTNPEARVSELQTGNPRKLTLLGKIPGTVADEKALHAKYIKFNELQEWFRPPGSLLSEFGYHKWKDGLDDD